MTVGQSREELIYNNKKLNNNIGKDRFAAEKIISRNNLEHLINSFGELNFTIAGSIATAGGLTVDLIN